ncbi:MAG: dNTP triphosphohydrolase [Planctomycetes bacterium]|nr:dNTP triphosphohydrolase [Planctomycetota bacterium]
MAMIQAAESNLAPYAIRSADCGGRAHAEATDARFGPFELDRLRIVSCAAFRRLEKKTQVFGAGLDDHFRTRLTHTLEVAQTARLIATGVRVNAVLAEAVALAHDLGHPPFGHAGEKALNEMMADHGGFNHNAHSLRVVEYLEHPSPPYRGLNLTLETRRGITTHKTRYDKPDSRASVSRSSDESEPRAAGFSPRGNTASEKPARPPGDGNVDAASCGVETLCPSVEAQVASLADRIAYNLHDVDDAIGARFLDFADLDAVSLWRESCRRVRERFVADEIRAVRRPILEDMFGSLVADAVQSMQAALSTFDSPAAARAAGPIAHMVSPAMEQMLLELESFLTRKVYRRREIAGADDRACRVVRDLFAHYQTDPSALPERFARRIPDQGAERVICDYIAGMTDRFCTTEHSRLQGR